jgi:S-adenosylmethionine/arginine decarboxylase-like enzyme
MKPIEKKANHVLVEGEASPEMLLDAERLHVIIDGQLVLHDIQGIHRHTHNFTEEDKKQGTSMIYILEGGHCCIHTCPKTRSYFLDILLGEEHGNNASAAGKAIAELLDGPFTMRTINRKMQEVEVIP